MTRKAAVFSGIVIFLLVPLTLFLGIRLTGRWYYLTCTLIVIEIMLPFFFSFETRRPQARELVLIAVLAALAAVSRAVFAFTPYLKTITGLIMLAGIACGPEAGFLTGAVAAFASNFFFGQGPWTPWQMFAYGFGGFFAGMIFHKHRRWARPWLLAPFGFLTILLLVGPMLDCCTVFTMLTTLSWKNVMIIFGQGVPVNFTHGIGTAITLAVAGGPMLAKLDRLRVKYGMMEEHLC